MEGVFQELEYLGTAPDEMKENATVFVTNLNMIIITVDQDARKLAHKVTRGDKYLTENIRIGDHVVSEEMKEILEKLLDDPDKYREHLQNLFTPSHTKAA